MSIHKQYIGIVLNDFKLYVMTATLLYQCVNSFFLSSSYCQVDFHN